mgnify:CR=1
MLWLRGSLIKKPEDDLRVRIILATLPGEPAILHNALADGVRQWFVEGATPCGGNLLSSGLCAIAHTKPSDRFEYAIDTPLSAAPSALEYHQIYHAHQWKHPALSDALVCACAQLAGLTAGQDLRLTPKINEISIA